MSLIPFLYSRFLSLEIGADHLFQMGPALFLCLDVDLSNRVQKHFIVCPLVPPPVNLTLLHKDQTKSRKSRKCRMAGEANNEPYTFMTWIELK